MIKREFIFTDVRPFASCHASSILPLADGRVLSAWFGGTHERHTDTAIWSAMRDTSGVWSAPRRIADEAGVPHWNPVLAVSPGGTLQLFYKAGPDCMNWRTRTMISSDAGTTWGTPIEPGCASGFPIGPVKNKPIVTSDGRWVAPTSLEGTHHWDSAVTISQDDGKSWILGGPVPIDHARLAGKGIIQPTLWESSPGQIHMLLRSTEGRIFRSDSPDNGQTWSHARPTDLPNNNSGIDVMRMSNGRLALCMNPVSADWGKRNPLVVVFSSDNGTTWGNELVLEDEDTSGDGRIVSLDLARRPGEYSYPSITEFDGKVMVSYTWQRERIAFVIIDALDGPVQPTSPG